jgi:hypothetical protein
MKIKDAIQVLKAEAAFGRTPSGRSINEYAQNAIEATLEDEKNYEMECMKCLNCCIILSGLLFPEGCPNCGSKDLETEINEGEIE